MAFFKISKGLKSKLPKTYNEGYCYFTTDDGKMYIDTSNASSGRVCLNAAKADQLATARTITLSGDASGSVSFDGSQNVTLAVDISALDNINDAIDAKQATITGAATTITSSNLTASRALISNSSGKVAVSAVTSTELGYLDGVTANIQTQLNNKQDKLTFDSAPTENSSNPVTSGGVYTEVNSAKMTASMAMPGSLKWDGYVGDRECVIVYEEPMDEGITVRMQFVHVSDYVPEILALIMAEVPAEGRILPVLMSMSGIEVGGMHQITPIEVQVADDMLITGDGFAFIPTDGYSLEGIAFPKKGWYFMEYSFIMGDTEIPVMYVSGLQIQMLNFPDTNGGGSDKYFEDVSVTTVVGDTLTWDGNTDGLVATNTYNPIDTASVTLYKLSDNVPTLADFSNGCTITVNQSGVSQSGSLSYDDIRTLSPDDGFCELQAWVVVPTNGYDYLNIFTFPEAGVYAVLQTGLGEVVYGSSLTIPGYNFTTTTAQKVIKTEHLPEALRFGEKMVETYGGTLAWDGDITKCDANIEGTLYHVSDVVPNMAECVSIEASLTFEEGSHKVNVLWEHQATPDIYRFFIENVSQTLGLVVTSEIVEGTVRYPAGLYLCKDNSAYVSSITFNGITPFVSTTTEVVKIDPKYLPDDIGGGNADLVVSEHNTDNSAHNDIRDLINGLNTRLNALADSDDVTLDQMSEIVAYIKSNKSLIDSVTTSKVNVSDIVNNLTTNVPNKPLSAAQGVAIKSLIDALQTSVNNKSDSNHTHNYAGSSSAGGAATSANKLTTARTISLSGAVSGSASFDGSTNVSITTSNGQHISNRGSGTYYYKLGTMVADNSGNYGNITISGRLGGWEQSSSANFDIMMLNRSSARDGNTITATVSASGNTVGAFGNCDIVVYRQDDTSEIVYLKLSGYWLYDFDWSVFQHSINYSATNVTPTGTLVWSLSGAPKTILSADGTLYATKFSGSFDGTIENATKATKDASGNVITDTYMTKVNPTGSGNVSIGRKSGTTIGDQSIAIGENTTASAEKTVAIGTSASATNTYAVAIGASATASGEQSTAIGTAPTASGKQSTALGVHTTAAGEYSTSMGCWTSSNGIAGTSLGNGSTVDTNSWAAVSSGIVTVARGMGQHVFGAYNIPDDAVDSYLTPAEHLLIVGNGDSSAKSNAMTVDWDGNAWFSGDVYVGSTSGTNKDDGAVKLSKDGHTHNYIPSVSSTNKAITRFNGTGGAVQNSKIIIEDTTNSRDNSKGQVIAIPTTGSKKMVYGLCTDQTDGTAFIGGLFGSSETSYPYASGLAIGGSSGNLLWKGVKVATTDDIESAIGAAIAASY